MQDVVIWHRPTCSKSRSALALLREAGIEPRSVDYVAQPPTVAELRQAIAQAGLRVREALRKGEPEYAALKLRQFRNGVDTGRYTPPLYNEKINAKAAVGLENTGGDASHLLTILSQGPSVGHLGVGFKGS